MATPSIEVSIKGSNNEYKQEYHFDIDGTQFQLKDCFGEFNFFINSEPLDKLFKEEIKLLENDAFDINKKIITKNSTYYVIQSFHLAIKLFEFEFDYGFGRIDEGDLSFVLSEEDFFKALDVDREIVDQFMLDIKFKYEQARFRKFKEYLLIKHTKGFDNYIYLSHLMDYYRRLPHYKRAAIVFFHFKYRILFLAILLVEEMITPSVLMELYIKVEQKTGEKSSESYNDEKEISIDAYKVLKFIECYNNQNIVDEILRGENMNVEFKESVWYNSYLDKVEREPNPGLLKTVAGFLNTDGGKLLIGVKDDKTICGIEKDDYHDDDTYILRLNEVLNSKITGQNINSITINIERIRNNRICVINCKKQWKPVFLKSSGKEEFYVRTGPSTRILQHSEMIEYLKVNGKI